MEDYKEKYEIGSIVTAKRTYNGEIITGEFSGFHLLDSTNPKSIAGVVHTPNGSYDVEPNSIESVISEDERIRKEIIDYLKGFIPHHEYDLVAKSRVWIAWLEKQSEQEQTERPNGEDYGIDSLYHAARILEKTLGDVEGYESDDGILEHKCAIEAVKRLYKQKPAWSEEDDEIVSLAIDILGYCQRNCEEVSDSSDNIEKVIYWLKSLKERVKGE